MDVHQHLSEDSAVPTNTLLFLTLSVSDRQFRDKIRLLLYTIYSRAWRYCGLPSRRVLLALRADTAEVAVAQGPVVEHFNVIEDIRTGQIPGFVDPFSNALFFQQTEERFGHHIIPAVATPTHTGG